MNCIYALLFMIGCCSGQLQLVAMHDWARRAAPEVDERCVICQEPLLNDLRTRLCCGHRFHLACANRWARESQWSGCALCRTMPEDVVEHYDQESPLLWTIPVLTELVAFYYLCMRTE